MHRKDILKQIKSDATDARIAKLRKEKKIKTWISLILKINTVSSVFENLSFIINKRTKKRYQKLLVMRIERYYKKAMRQRAATV